MNKEHLDSLIKSTKKLHLLYVEDDTAVRDSTLKFLETFFLKIDIAVDGKKAYEKEQAKKYDIIITDINMPNLNGIQLIEKIRKNDDSIPILILSCHDDKDYFTQSIKFGVDGYILKPVELEQFCVIISKIVRRIELEKSLVEYQTNLEKKVEEKTREIRHRYYHEAHTDLPNSQKLQVDIIEDSFNYLLLLDISGFSVINKEYGRVFANNVLIRVARILEHHIHRRAKLYKIESDRFVILLKINALQEVHDYCNQIVAFFDTRNVKVDDAELNINFNIGIAKVQDDITKTLINSEYALDKSKNIGSRNYEIFEEDISCFKDEKESIKWLKTTRALILQEKIELYFQPIKNVKTDEIIKYEVLARGIVANKVVAPIFFIRAAKKLGLITSITRIIINKSFDFFQDKKYDFSINITERDLLENYLIDFIKEKIKTYNIAPSRVTFEILDNITLSKNNSIVTEQLKILREIGFKISIDDFGIKNLNFSRLLEINLDFIKIDGAFIKNLKEDTRNRTITKAIVELSKTLGIKTVAEFVEEEEVYNIIKECGIDYAQGYYIGKPASRLIS